jgi:hypothetical protein
MYSTTQSQMSKSKKKKRKTHHLHLFTSYKYVTNTKSLCQALLLVINSLPILKTQEGFTSRMAAIHAIHLSLVFGLLGTYCFLSIPNLIIFIKLDMLYHHLMLFFVSHPIQAISCPSLYI